jgi:hypothetical protein
MTPDKKHRAATAIGFISGMLACLDPLRDLKEWWPLDEVWAMLRPPQRLEFGGGIVLIFVTLIVSIARRRSYSP